jgi:perosamine synthetase
MSLLEDNVEFIPISQPSIGELERKYLLDAFDSGWISSIGHYIDDFEKAFASYCGARHAVAVSNGTVALHLSLVALGIGPGDEVVVPDLTFVATANAVRHAGATPVIVDVERDTLCMDPALFERAITRRTKAVIPVHLYGHPADMDRICAIAKDRGIAVVEDGAEAHGATIGTRRVGSFGDCSAFSFYANKLITTGEGGMIATSDDELAARLRYLRDHAMSKTRKYYHTEVGFNYRTTNLQAAIGLAQIQRIDGLLAKKRGIFARYAKDLEGLEGTHLNRTRAGYSNSYWMVCLSAEAWDDASRSAFMIALKERGVDSRPFFCPMSDMPMYASRKIRSPVSRELAYKGINIPSFGDMTMEQVDHASSAILELLRKR